MTIVLDMPSEKAGAAAAMLDKAAQILTWSEEAFGFLERPHSDQDHVGHHGFAALTGLCALGIGGFMDQACDDLANLAHALRAGGGQHERTKA